MVKDLLKVILVLGGLQQAEHPRMLNMYEADLGIPKTAVFKILMQDLGMKCVVAKLVPWLLLPEQKEHGAAVADDLIQTTTNEPGFLR